MRLVESECDKRGCLPFPDVGTLGALPAALLTRPPAAVWVHAQEGWASSCAFSAASWDKGAPLGCSSRKGITEARWVTWRTMELSSPGKVRGTVLSPPPGRGFLNKAVPALRVGPCVCCLSRYGRAYARLLQPVLISTQDRNPQEGPLCPSCFLVRPDPPSSSPSFCSSPSHLKAGPQLQVSLSQPCSVGCRLPGDSR